jgi:hypothetical protein
VVFFLYSCKLRGTCFEELASRNSLRGTRFEELALDCTERLKGRNENDHKRTRNKPIIKHNTGPNNIGGVEKVSVFLAKAIK